MKLGLRLAIAAFVAANIGQSAFADTAANWGELRTFIQTPASTSATITQNITATNSMPSYSSGSKTISGGGFTLSGNAPASGYTAFSALTNGSISINNLTISNFKQALFADNNGQSPYSGTITIGPGVVFENNGVSNNPWGGGGGAIYSEFNTQIADGTVFRGNKEVFGGAIYNKDTMYIGNNVIFDSNIAAYDGGGALGLTTGVTSRGAANWKTIIGDGVSFTNNRAVYGGAIYNQETYLEIGDNAVFSGNNASYAGALCNVYSDAVTIIGENAQFINNRSTGSGQEAGAIGNEYGSVEIGAGALFQGNSAVSVGGAIFNLDGIITLKTATDKTTAFIGNTDSAGANDVYLLHTGVVIPVLNISGTGGTIDFQGGIASNNSGTIIEKSSTGEMILGANSKNADFKGTFTQTAGSTTVYGEFFSGSAANNIENSALNLYQSSSSAQLGRLNLLNAGVNSINDTITTFSTTGFAAEGTSNFSIDIDGLAGTSDKFVLTSATGNGILNVQNFKVLNAPTAVTVDIPVFTGAVSGYTFTASGTEVVTPIYIYKVTSLDNPTDNQKGVYRLWRRDAGGSGGGPGGPYNPATFRGQVATLAQYQNQLLVNNTLFDHIYLDSEYHLANRKDNKYAAVSELFAPYQYKTKEGSLWTKTYVAIEKLSMTQGLTVNNTAYGQIVGADFPALKLQKGWEFIPTAFIAYNGGRQSYSGVTSYQNGGQGGFMGTFMKGDSINSILAYAGGYANEMGVNGVTDNTGNWFAGAAVKSAYNFHPTRNLTIQPNLLASYNIFGKQKWNSDFGAISMNSGLLNGINIAPGVNLIYGKETWSVYLTALYMYNINDNVNGSAGPVDLPNVRMRHGYIEYGVGATKTWKDRLMGYVQVVMRNGGRTGVGFQLGLSWKF